MKITETHKNFPCGSKGRLTIKSDADVVLAVIFTPVQQARKFCEANPETPQGLEFAQVLHDEAVIARKVELGTRLEDLEAEVADTTSGSVANHLAIESLLQFQNDNMHELVALGICKAPVTSDALVEVIIQSRRDAAKADAAVSSPVPAPPVLEGKNAANTALVSAQRKLVKLYEAAQGPDPVLALNGIRTSRGNKYLNTCDDYRVALLAHFAQEGVDAAG